MALLRDGLARFLRSASVGSLQNLKLRRLGELSDLRRELQAVLEECQQVQVELEVCELVLAARERRIPESDLADLVGGVLPSTIPLLRAEGLGRGRPAKRRS